MHLTLADARTVHGAMFFSLTLLRRGYNFYQTNGFYAGILLMLNVLLIFILIHIQMFIVDDGLWKNTIISIGSFCDLEILAFNGSVNSERCRSV